MAVDVGSAVGYLDLDISGFLAGLKSAQSEADKVSKNIVTKIGNNISGAGKSLSSAGATLTKNVTVPLAAIGAAGLKVATDFEKGMSEVKAISGTTGKDFDALRNKAIDLGADTAFSANEVAAAMTEMAKAGWNSQQIIDGMGGVLDATAASGESLASVSTIVADAITGFGLEAKDSTRLADLLTQAANSGTIGISDLGESFKYIAPVAGAMGLSVEDVTTALSAMSMAGIKGSQAGTSLRTMLTRMVKPTDAVAAAMDELGISVTNQDGSMKSLDDIVSNLRTSFDGLTESEKAKYAATLAGQEGMAGMLSLLNLTEEEYNAIAVSMDNAGGVAQKTASIMQDNLQSKVEQLGGSLESLAIKLADHVIPHLQDFVVWLTGVVDKFAQLDPEIQKTILKFAGIAAAVGPVLSVVGGLVSGFGGLITTIGKIPGAITKVKTGFVALATGLKNVGEGIKLAKAGFPALGAEASKLGVAIGGITAPVLAVVAVIATLAAAFVSLWKNNENFKNNFIEIWNQIKSSFDKLCSGIVDRINSLGFDFTNITQVLSTVWTEFCNLLAPIFEGAFQIIADVFDTVVNVILGILDTFIATFKGDWESAWESLKGVFESVWNGIVSILQSVGNTLLGVLNTICSWFGTTWSDTWNSIKDFFVGIWEGIVSWFQNALNNISSFFVNTWTNISNTFKSVWNGIASAVSSAFETIKNVIQVGIMFIVELVSASVQLITLPFAFIWENCKTVVMSAWDSIKSSVSNALASVKSAITNAMNTISSTFKSVWSSISSTISTVWSSISSKISSVLSAIKTNISNAWNSIKSSITNSVNAIKSAITNTFNSIKSTITSVFNSIKSTVTSVWSSIKSAIESAINSAKNTVSSAVNSIKSAFSSGFNTIKSTVSSVFNGIKSTISSAMDSAKSAVSNAINAIKSAFNITLSFPKIKLPHISISGEFSLNPPSVPHFDIEWYKKAMGNGMILDSATIFGFNPKTGKFLGGGEAGSETIVGTKNLMSMIKKTVADAVGPLIQASRELAITTSDLGYVTYNGFTKLKEVRESQDKFGHSDSGNGDTFVFYSPKAIDEIEAAKQMKKTKRELAEGF